MEWASPEVLRAFRATSSRYLRRADVLLSHHLLIAATESDNQGELAAEICPLRPSDEYQVSGALYVPHGRHPALRHLFDPTPAVSTSVSAPGGAYGFFNHENPSTVSDLRLAVRQASAVQGVLESTEVVDVAGRLSTQTTRQLRASAVNAQLYRLHLDPENTHLLAEFDTLKRVTLSLHFAPEVAAQPIYPRGLQAVRRLILNVQLGDGSDLNTGPFCPPAWAQPSSMPGVNGRELEVVICPATRPLLDALGAGTVPDTALGAIRTAYAAAISFALALTAGSTAHLICLGLDNAAYAALGISDHETEYLLRLEVGRLEALLLDTLPSSQHEHVRRTFSTLRFVPRSSYVQRIGEAHFALETGATWFGGNEMTHAADESYNDSFTLVDSGSESLQALVQVLQQSSSTPGRNPQNRVPSVSPSFVVVEPPEGAEHYYPAPRRRLTRTGSKRHRKRTSVNCLLM